MTIQVGTACGDCGAPNLGTNFCETCGAPVVASATAPAAPSSPLRSFSLWIAFGLYALSPFVGIIQELTAPNWEDYQAYQGSQIAFTIVRILVMVAVAAALTIAAFANRRSTGAKVGVIALAIVGAFFGIAPSQFYSYLDIPGFLVLVAFFLAWAVGARFRGWGYFGLLLILGVVTLETVANGFLLGPLYWSVGAGVLIVQLLLSAALAFGVVLLSLHFEKAFAKRVARPWSIAPAYGYAPGYVPSSAVGPPQPGGTPGPYGPGASHQYYAPRTSGFAIAALVLGIAGGSVLPIIFGHIALSQIRRTGEGGRGMAVAGLVLGYFWAVALLIYFIVVISVTSRYY